MIKKASVYLILFALLIAIVSGCGARKMEAGETANSAPASMDAKADYDGRQAVASYTMKDEASQDRVIATAEGEKKNALAPGNNPVNSGHKVIKTGEVHLETLNFEDTVGKLTKYVSSIGGFVENSSVNGNRLSSSRANTVRTAYFVFRIPQNQYDKIFTDVKDFGTVVFEQSRGEDITDRYFDTEARLKSLKIQEERLLSLLQKAGKMEDILAIERELQNTRYQIENSTGTIRKWDSLISFSTVSVNVTEVQEIKAAAPDARNRFFERMSFGFSNSVRQLWSMTQELMLGIVVFIPFLIPIAIIILGVLYFIKRKKNLKRQGEKKSPEVEASEKKAEERTDKS